MRKQVDSWYSDVVFAVLCAVQVYRSDAADQVRQAPELETRPRNARSDVDHFGRHLVANCSRYELHRTPSRHGKDDEGVDDDADDEDADDDDDENVWNYTERLPNLKKKKKMLMMMMVVVLVLVLVVVVVKMSGTTPSAYQT